VDFAPVSLGVQASYFAAQHLSKQRQLFRLFRAGGQELYAVLVAGTAANDASKCQVIIREGDLCLVPNRQVAVHGECETSRIQLRAATADNSYVPEFFDCDSNGQAEFKAPPTSRSWWCATASCIYWHVSMVVPTADSWGVTKVQLLSGRGTRPCLLSQAGRALA
jgi:hypothetical protein